MTSKTVAERLRDAVKTRKSCSVDIIGNALGRAVVCDNAKSCFECEAEWFNALADMIEAEQVQAVSKALKGAKPQLPEGVIWPRFEDGELVKFGDEVFISEAENKTIKVDEIRLYSERFYINGTTCDGTWLFTPILSSVTPVKRPEPEVLDADNVPIKVGDTVYDVRDGSKWTVSHIENADMVLLNNAHQVYVNNLTHRKPDTQEAIDADCWVDAKDYCEKYGVKTEWPKHYGKAKCEHLLARQRKLLGGE